MKRKGGSLFCSSQFPSEAIHKDKLKYRAERAQERERERERELFVFE